MHRRHQEAGARRDGPCGTDQLAPCRPERSEGPHGVSAGTPLAIRHEILRFAQDDGLKDTAVAKKPDLDRTVVAQNRKARHNYFIEETFEAGLALTGTEVKSLRGGRSTIAESYVTEEGGEAWLVNANIPEYASGNRFNHEPRRPRKLLLHRKQINKLVGAIQREGRTVVPLQLYFNPRGRAKIEIALVTGKQAHDKRQAIKDRDWQRQRARLLSHR